MKPILATFHGIGACESRTVELAREHVLAGIEVTLDPRNVHVSVSAASLLSLKGGDRIPLRYHFPLCDHEISSPEDAVAQDALSTVRLAVRAIADEGGDYLTVHAALPADSYGTPRFEETIERLTELREFATAQGVVLALENLRWGATCDPEIFLEVVDRSGVAITFDVGHAISSQFSAADYSAARFIARCGTRLRSAHVYGREEDRHYPPTDLGVISPSLDALRTLGCHWWTVELPDPAEARATRLMLAAYLAESGIAELAESPALS